MIVATIFLNPIVKNCNNINKYNQVAAFVPSKPFINRKYLLLSTVDIVDNDTDRTPSSSSSKPTTNTNSKLSNLFPSLAMPLKELNFLRPTPIQSASANRALLDQENLLMIAPTGSGKTLAYLLPVLEKVVVAQQQNGDGAPISNTVLVVAPTRELALQLMRVTESILFHLNNNDNDDDGGKSKTFSVLLAVQGVELPSSEQLNEATVLIGTPTELQVVLTQIQGGQEFIAGDVLSSVILDEVDVLLPNPPKQLRTSFDHVNEKSGSKKSNTPQDERRRKEEKRKFMAAQRKGMQFSSSKKQIVIRPTETLLKMIASRRFYVPQGVETTPYQVLAGSATASRKTLDRLNKALRDAAMDALLTTEVVWNGNVKSCRSSEANTDSIGENHTIRAVTVPRQIKHQYICLGKDVASSPSHVLSAVVKTVNALKPQRALLFLCGEFRKSISEEPIQKQIRKQGTRIQPKKKKQSIAQKKRAATEASRAKSPNVGISARNACSTLIQMGIKAKPLHVALGFKSKAKYDDEDTALPQIIVTYEGSSRGLDLDDVETIFVMGRPSSAESYLHLAGRVGRSCTAADGEVVIQPGNVISFCTKGSATERNKWTKQIGGTDLEELILED